MIISWSLELLRVQEANNAIGITDGMILRGRHNDCLIGPSDGIAKALFDAGRAVDEDVIMLFFQILAKLSICSGSTAFLSSLCEAGKQI